jgi:hypothetical protein
LHQPPQLGEDGRLHLGAGIMEARQPKHVQESPVVRDMRPKSIRSILSQPPSTAKLVAEARRDEALSSRPDSTSPQDRPSPPACLPIAFVRWD